MRHLEFIPPHFDPPTTPDEQPDLPNLPLPAPSTPTPSTPTPTPAPIHSDRHPLNRLRQRKDQYNEESSSSSSSSSNNFGSSTIKINNPELLHSLLPMVMGLYVALLLFLYLILRHAKREREREEGINIPQQVSRMSSEQRREYFGYLFRANNTQRTLRSEQIKIRTKNKGCNGHGHGGDSGDGGDGGDGGGDDKEAQWREIDVEQPSSSTFEDNDNDNDASVCLSLSDGDSDDNDNDNDNDNEDTNRDKSSKRNKSRNSNSNHNNNHNHNNHKKKKKKIPNTTTSSSSSFSKISGECAICLEIYKSGDRVVRSEDKSRCPHVFHKECLVEYLAVNKQKHNDPEQQRKDREAPPKCPICRQPFCVLLAPPPKRHRSRSSSTGGGSRKS